LINKLNDYCALRAAAVFGYTYTLFIILSSCLILNIIEMPYHSNRPPMKKFLLVILIAPIESPQYSTTAEIFSTLSFYKSKRPLPASASTTAL
jgi:hypothetical protein